MRVDVSDRQLVNNAPERATPRASAEAPFGNDVRTPDGGAAAPDGWRWIPDPEEDRVPEPAGSGLGPAEPLIRALAWASLHAWG